METSWQGILYHSISPPKFSEVFLARVFFALLSRNLRDHQVEQLRGGAFGGLDDGALGWPQVNARAFMNFVILVVERNAALAVHEVDQLVLTRGRGVESFARLQPAQRAQHIL